MEKILLKSAYSKSSSNENVSIPIELANSQKTFTNTVNELDLNQYSQYVSERSKCNTIRLTTQVNLVASNVLFNQITEVVKNEESKDCKSLNFKEKYTCNSSLGKSATYDWSSDVTELIRDTQMSSEFDKDKNFTYHCGIDIFNNHILRSKTFTPIYYSTSQSTCKLPTFNTLADYIRDDGGLKPISCITKKGPSYTTQYMRIYQKSNSLSFQDSINENLVENDGWLGFFNKSKTKSYDDTGNDIGISRVINNKGENNFIDMFPGREYYKLTPHYNADRDREEKNWEYCLTYPFSSTTEDIPCINSKLKALKVAHIDENTYADDGIRKTIIYSSCKHGLTVDDTVIIYKTDSSGNTIDTIPDVLVEDIIDGYTFVVFLSDMLCNEWINELDKDVIETKFKNGSISYDTHTYTVEGCEYYGFNKYINADKDAQHIVFAKMIEGEQCEYYVRIFSKLPNLSLSNNELAKVTNKKDYYNTVCKYRGANYEFQSVISDMAFSKNAYGDNIAQIVFNDDIKLDNLVDNLNRPITKLYLTLIKTNYGRKDWYENKEVGSGHVEFSHWFGKVNAGLEYSPYADIDEFNIGNIRSMNNIDDGYKGLKQTAFQKIKYDSDEVIYSNQEEFYGDLCEYSRYNCIETVLQPIMYRFNTQQRELSGNYNETFEPVYYDEIEYDDYDVDNDYFILSVPYDTEPTSKREGYFYQANYEIPIKTISEEIFSLTPIFYTIFSLSKYGTNVHSSDYEIKTAEANYIDLTSEFYLYNIETMEVLKCKPNRILWLNDIVFNVIDDSGSNIELVNTSIANYKMFKKPSLIPNYATMTKDGTCTYRWRDIYQNGLEPTVSTVTPEYPFVNNSLYVNNQINVFVKRQDPFGEYGLNSDDIISTRGIQSSIDDTSSTNNDNVFNESDLKC